MTRVFMAAIGLLSAGFASSASAQSFAPPPVPVAQTVAMTNDHAAKVAKLVDGACGPAPAAAAPASDKDIYAQCRSVATTRAEALIH